MLSNAEAPCAPALSPLLNLLPEETAARTRYLLSPPVFVSSQVTRFTSLYYLTPRFPGDDEKSSSQNVGPSLLSLL